MAEVNDKKYYECRQSFALSREMKAILDDYCESNDIPKSVFIRRTVFKKIASKGNKWKNLIENCDK